MAMLACQSSPGPQLWVHHWSPGLYHDEMREGLVLCIPLEGARFRLTGTAEQSDAARELASRDIVLMPAGRRYGLCWLQTADIVIVQVKSDSIRDAPWLRTLLDDKPLAIRDAFASRVADESRRLLHTVGHISGAYGDAMAAVITHSIAFKTPESDLFAQPPRARLTTAQIARLERYVDQHIDQPIRLDELAGELLLTRWHLMKRFKALHGMSPYRFVTERRLARAQELLLQTDWPIIRVALEVGMTHSHFSRTFTASFGVTPLMYRRNQARTEISVR